MSRHDSDIQRVLYFVNLAHTSQYGKWEGWMDYCQIETNFSFTFHSPKR